MPKGVQPPPPCWIRLKSYGLWKYWFENDSSNKRNLNWNISFPILFLLPYMPWYQSIWVAAYQTDLTRLWHGNVKVKLLICHIYSTKLKTNIIIWFKINMLGYIKDIYTSLKNGDRMSVNFSLMLGYAQSFRL